MASAVTGESIITDHVARDCRDENLLRTVDDGTPAVLYGWLRPMPSNRFHPQRCTGRLRR